MKLLFCDCCHDVRSMPPEPSWVECRCKNVRARYVDGLNAEWNGRGYLLGFANGSFVEAIRSQRIAGDRPDGLGWRFEAFIIPSSAPSVRILK